MRSLLAHIAVPTESPERRRTQRRTLRLDVSARSSTDDSTVIIRNLSRTGLMIETDAAFGVGETFLLLLPELGAAPARIVRGEGRSYGCEFLSPVPASAISAALLKAPHGDDADAIADTASDPDDLIAKPPTSAVLLAVLTALFTAVALLFIIALASLNFSSN